VCGIAGILHADSSREIDEPTLRRMAGAIRHRGPDGYGIASGGGAGLVSTRLAIFDIPSGWQPMQGAHRDTVMVYNGEVFNHYELRHELEAAGERFRTTSDTEILLRLLDLEGPRALHRCNGQWGIAHLERPTRTLTLMRDRFGVRPLHYAQLPDGGIVFSSEIKGILASGLVDAAPDLEGIDEVFTFWAARPPRCAFKGIRLLPPGHLLVWRDGEIVEERPWWEPRYAIDAAAPGPLRDRLLGLGRHGLTG
jgi:asparagine synthase (glutamine-hydrolysing)